MSVLNITTDNFNDEVINCSKPVLVDFWAAWCGPCSQMSSIIEEISNEITPEIKVGKINVDEQPELARQFDIISIPTFAVFKNGNIVTSTVGTAAKSELLNMLNIN